MERLLRAMENPSDFTDEELEQLMDDEELRDCYNLAVKAEQGFKMRKKALPRQEKPLIWKVAAVFISLIMLSGITIAAIQYVKFLDDKKNGISHFHVVWDVCHTSYGDCSLMRAKFNVFIEKDLSGFDFRWLTAFLWLIHLILSLPEQPTRVFSEPFSAKLLQLPLWFYKLPSYT